MSLRLSRLAVGRACCASPRGADARAPPWDAYGASDAASHAAAGASVVMVVDGGGGGGYAFGAPRHAGARSSVAG